MPVMPPLPNTGTMLESVIWPCRLCPQHPVCSFAFTRPALGIASRSFHRLGVRLRRFLCMPETSPVRRPRRRFRFHCRRGIECVDPRLNIPWSATTRLAVPLGWSSLCAPCRSSPTPSSLHASQRLISVSSRRPPDHLPRHQHHGLSSTRQFRQRQTSPRSHCSDLC
ncbi:hypothetical protein OG21DRAFT_766683 [Imleria badia]|nr:hypothetical protein OG21DRAFT_766683 [Imleria badia]